MKRPIWLGLMVFLLLGNLVLLRLYVVERGRTRSMLRERAQQVQGNLHVASVHIQKITTPDAPDAQFWIQLTVRNLAEAENAFNQLTPQVLTLNPAYLRTMPRHIQRMREQLENMAWSRDYSALPEVKEAVESLAKHLDDNLDMQNWKDYLVQFRDLVQSYESPTGLR